MPQEPPRPPERMSPEYQGILERAVRVLDAEPTRDTKLGAIAALLSREVPHFDWVGFYLVDPESPRELVLGPYVGAPTEHTRIPFGRGVCGQVAESRETMIVQDVTAEANYLACSLDVRSEIVVPILAGGAFVAQLDVDSHVVSAITEDDRALCEGICAALAAHI